MKYIILIYAEEGVWPVDEHAEALAESIRLCHELHKQGQYLVAAPLHPVAAATCVRVRQGTRFLHDGPYAETKEHLAGFFLVEVANLDEAISIAERIPGSRRGTAEIRPVVELDGMPDVASPA
jgi:hypothetical protein